MLQLSGKTQHAQATGAHCWTAASIECYRSLMDDVTAARWRKLVESYGISKPGASPWDAALLDDNFSGASHGEKCTIKFLLNLWNADYDWHLEPATAGSVSRVGRSTVVAITFRAIHVEFLSEDACLLRIACCNRDATGLSASLGTISAPDGSKLAQLPVMPGSRS